MALIEKEVIDRIEIVGDFKHIQIRVSKRIVDDQTNEIKAENFHRDTCTCGDMDKAIKYSVGDIANVIWTDEIKNSYKQQLKQTLMEKT